MAATLEKIYEVALHHYHMKLVAGREGLSNLVDWVMWWKKWIMCIS